MADTPGSTPTVDRARVQHLMAAEEAAFVERHPRSRELHERARRSLVGGVPMTWMVKWAGPYPVFLAEASGAHAVDVDGNEYVDLCLGDTGAMAGHGPEPTIAAVERQLRRGITHMLPTEDAAWAGEELTRRFGLPLWQFTMTATDANRFALRLAREITGRPFVAVHEYCYHGTVDETLAVLDGTDPATGRGRTVARRGNLGPQVDPARTTRVVPYNDLDALDRELADGQVAALLIEPVLTNVGIVLPEAGYLDGVRELTRRHGTVLIHDETHTICAGPGGVTGGSALSEGRPYEPDMLVIGKTIGGGIPAAAYGMTEEVAALLIEPVLTNVGIVLPEAGYLEGVRELTRRHGTILIHDETHTICAGPGGVTGGSVLSEGRPYEPDMLVIGKTIGGGIPAAAYGMTEEVAARVDARVTLEDVDIGGIGGTLAGYALSMAAIRATLGEVLTEAAFARMIPLAERWERGAADAMARRGAPWNVTRLGARAEYHFMPHPARDGAEQIANADPELERLLHLWCLNRGILLTPFHNMALMSPATTEADVDRHSAAFDEALAALYP